MSTKDIGTTDDLTTIQVSCKSIKSNQNEDEEEDVAGDGIKEWASKNW